MNQQAAACEEARTLVPELVQALWDWGLMQWMNPREAGGREPGFRELIDTWQELAWQDGAFGWIGIANLPSAAFAARTTAIREGSRLERAFRDMYTGTQHTFIGEKTYTDAAQVMLGLIPDNPGL